MHLFHTSARRFLRYILALETRAVLRKHRPPLIALCGDDQTAFIQEALYELALISAPARRTLERADSEFSIPLTVFGTLSYPRWPIAWLGIILKTAIQLITIRPYTHTLIIHVDGADPSIRDYWLQVLSPTYVIVPGGTRMSHTFPVLVLHSNDILTAQKTAHISPALHTILTELKIPETEAKRVLHTLEPPEPRVRLLAGKNGTIVIDARYHYYPPSLVALAEICTALAGKKLMVKDFTISHSFSIPDTTISTTLSGQDTTPYETFIFVTRKGRYSDEISRLVDNPLEV